MGQIIFKNKKRIFYRKYNPNKFSYRFPRVEFKSIRRI